MAKMLTKTQFKIMEVFVSEIKETFSIKQLSEIIEKPYPLVHRSIKYLIERKIIIKDKRGLLSLNFRDNYMELAYVESLRKDKFLNKNKTIKLFVKDVLEKIGLDFFIFIFFGSIIKKDNARDLDVLIVLDNNEDIGKIEGVINNISSNFSLQFDINIISLESMHEMLFRRHEKNIINETLNNHILIFGAENYYKVLKNV